MGEKKEKKVGRNKNGKFTKNNNMGKPRATIYRRELCEELIKYVSTPPSKVMYDMKYNDQGKVIRKTPKIVAAGYPSFKGFAAKVGVTEKTLLEWTVKHKEFGEAYELAKDIQAHLLYQNGLNRQYDPGFARFLLEACHGVVAKNINVHEAGAGCEVNFRFIDPSENEEKR